MNTRHALIVLIVAAFVLAACAGNAEQISVTRQAGQEPLPQATEYFYEEQGAQVEVTRVVTEQVVVTAIAGATAEPSSPYQPQPLATYSPAATASPVGMPAATPPIDNFFEDYGVNPFVPTSYDHLSTFALDVDTASYSVVRRYLRDGLMPPPEAVRVEEFVNYFDQEYPIPPEVAFAIYADGAPSPFHYDGSYLLRIGVQGYDVPEAQRPPASLTFVIDVSGSMAQENRLELVKQSLEMLVDRLRPDDVVAIAVYGTEARVVLEPTGGNDKGVILGAIYTLQPEGSTNAEAGLQLGYQMANAAYRPGAINRVILASDGVANVGVTNPDALAEQIRGYADSGITLTTVGFGMGNFNDVLMEQLADQGDGNYAYVDTLAEAQKLFVEDLTSTLQVIALDARVQVDFNPEVVSQYRLIGYENRAVADPDFRNDAVDAGEIGAGHTVTALYAVQFYPGATGRLATVQLRWQEPQTRQVQEINGNVNTWDLATSFDAATPRYQLAVVVSQFAELLRYSYWAGDTSYSQLSVYAERLAAQIPYDEEVAEFAGLVAQAGQLRR
ncbi:MAG: VWA domain-containing protein [Chloroflexi bacterium]|nr:VWA domain-containing protein [Chloroflexota bacterium]MCI0576448.1 VWA domain-containing protein [Chloroflexota bacterium]MCI0647268.1 VWA domain-containing protein [Chloroflexota bacterium]